MHLMYIDRNTESEKPLEYSEGNESKLSLSKTFVSFADVIHVCAHISFYLVNECEVCRVGTRIKVYNVARYDGAHL